MVFQLKLQGRKTALVLLAAEAEKGMSVVSVSPRSQSFVLTFEKSLQL